MVDADCLLMATRSPKALRMWGWMRLWTVNRLQLW